MSRPLKLELKTYAEDVNISSRPQTVLCGVVAPHYQQGATTPCNNV